MSTSGRGCLEEGECRGMYTESRVRQCTLLPCCRGYMEVHKMTTLVTLMLKSYNQAHKAILAGTVTLLYK